MSEAADFQIEIGGLSDDRVIALLQAHLELMRSQSPPESTHALDIDGLRRPNITFWTAKLDGEPVGCIALKALDATHGEIKSMHTAQAARSKGIAQAMLAHLEAVARDQGMHRLSLETGAPDGFAPARALYQRAGYEICGPFGNYAEDPFSVFMTKSLM
ncbi:GNAT family N-acetyltransferase [Pseudahrensia aquimaris]|uniref:GNAT family N-acetyltransferase n=1 Tax=Pseudahrensia aquimaris TaxID=744461 RepID=A0ABW3FD84_9HYPH